MEAAILRLRVHPMRPPDDTDFLARTYTLPLAAGDHAGFATARLRELIALRPAEPILQLDLALGEARAGHADEAQRLLDATKQNCCRPTARPSSTGCGA